MCRVSTKKSDRDPTRSSYLDCAKPCGLFSANPFGKRAILGLGPSPQPSVSCWKLSKRWRRKRDSYFHGVHVFCNLLKTHNARRVKTGKKAISRHAPGTRRLFVLPFPSLEGRFGPRCFTVPPASHPDWVESGHQVTGHTDNATRRLCPTLASGATSD